VQRPRNTSNATPEPERPIATYTVTHAWDHGRA
jgi:hypothetical protein